MNDKEKDRRQTETWTKSEIEKTKKKTNKINKSEKKMQKEKHSEKKKNNTA